MEIDLSWLESAFMKKEGIKRVVSIEREKGVPEGNNFGSEICRLTIQLETSSGLVLRLPGIVKTLPPNQELTDFLLEHYVFQREINMFEHVFPEMDKIIQEHGQKGLDNVWPVCLAYREYDYLALEDLKANGFEMLDKTVGLSIEEALVALKSLARFHALSHVLAESGTLDLATLLPQHPTKLITEQYFKDCLNKLLNVIRKTWPKEWEEAANKLEAGTTNFEVKLKKLRGLDETKFNGICHGDVWTNNIMFRHSSGRPTEAKLLDYQVSSYNSCAFDVVNLLHSSMVAEVREPARLKLLTSYHEELISTLGRYSHHCNRVPSLQEFQEEMERLNFQALLFSCCYLPATLSSPQHALDIDTFFKDDLDRDESLRNSYMFMTPKYTESFREDLQYFIRKGTI